MAGLHRLTLQLCYELIDLFVILDDLLVSLKERWPLDVPGGLLHQREGRVELVLDGLADIGSKESIINLLDLILPDVVDVLPRVFVDLQFFLDAVQALRVA